MSILAGNRPISALHATFEAFVYAKVYLTELQMRLFNT